MIVVGKVQKFEIEQPRGFPEIKLDPGAKIGYLPVYPDRESAAKEYPDGPFFEIREVEPTREE